MKLLPVATKVTTCVLYYVVTKVPTCVLYYVEIRVRSGP